MITCLSCGAENRREAKYCASCGASLSPLSANPAVEAQPEPKSGLAQAVRRWVGGKGQVAETRPLQAVPPTPEAVDPPPEPASGPAVGRLKPLHRDSILVDPQNAQRRYGIATARELARSTYYDALDLTCSVCDTSQPAIPPNGTCQQCQASLRPVLIHERRPRPNQSLQEADVRQLIDLSIGHPNVLPHRAIIQYQESIYTVVEHPGRWGVLVRGQQRRSPEEALAGAAQVGHGLTYLHDHGFAHAEVGGASLESLIVAGGKSDLKLADLSTCVRLSSDDHQTLRAQIDGDVAFLAALLFYLATGKALQRSSLDLAPDSLQPFIEQAMQGQYGSVSDMLADFALMPSTLPGPRPLKPSHGQATHPGQKHPRNEDAIVTFTFDKEQEGQAVPIGFYLVADGMGGHDAGDLASRTVNQIVTDWIIKTKVLPNLEKSTRKLTIEDVPSDLLTQAISKANDTLLRHGQKKNSDLGSTVTTALIIGDVATIANVGDSRTYLLRDGRLEQITQDHSLVARLVDAEIIKPEEVRSHPQRNQIYRTLGHKPDVEVDTFTRQLRADDVLLLCSDGLWEMVLDDQIQQIIEQAPSPQKACDALVEAANRAGGEDNIGIIVVRME